MINTYRYEFANTAKNVSKFFNPLKKIAFEFPAQSMAFYSENFFKLPEIDPKYETYVSIFCSSPINEGKRLVKIQTSVEPIEYATKRFHPKLVDILKSVNAKEVK